jgi:hypothetical protein
LRAFLVLLPGSRAKAIEIKRGRRGGELWNCNRAPKALSRESRSVSCQKYVSNQSVVLSFPVRRRLLACCAVQFVPEIITFIAAPMQRSARPSISLRQCEPTTMSIVGEDNRSRQTVANYSIVLVRQCTASMWGICRDSPTSRVFRPLCCRPAA